MGERRTRGIGGNTALNLGSALAPIVLTAITVPLYVDAVGVARFGVLSLAWLLLGYFGVFNLGLGRATANDLAKLRDASAEERQNVFWTALAMNAALGLVGGAALLAFGRLLVRQVLDLPQSLQLELLDALPWLALGVPFLTISIVCYGALEGLERFAVVNSIQVATAFVFQLAPLAVAHAVSPSLSSVVPMLVLAPVLGAVLAIVACARLLPLAGRPRVDGVSARRLFRYGGWVTVSDLVGPLLTVLDRFAIGAVSGARALGVYAVPSSVVTRLGVLPMSLARALFPRLSLLSELAARSIARTSTRALAVVMTPLVVVALVLAEPLLRAWVGDGIAGEGAPVAEILLVGLWFNSLAFIPSTSLLARRRPDVPAKLHVAELPPYLAGLWAALTLWGIEGAAAAWTVRVVVDAALLAYASGLYGRRDLLRAAPVLLVLFTYTAARTLFEDDLARAVLGSMLVALSVVWSLRAAPDRLRLMLSTPWSARPAP